MTRIVSLLVVLAVAPAGFAGAQVPPQQDPGSFAAPDIRDQKRPLNLLVTVGGGQSDDTALTAMLTALPDVKWTKAVMPKDAGLLKQGLEKQYDAVLFADSYQRTPAEQKDLAQLLSRRMGFVILNPSNPTWAGIPEAIGGKASGQAGAPAKVTVKTVEAAHPVTRGVKDFVVTDRVAPAVTRTPDALPVLKAESPVGGDDVLAWSVMYGNPYGLARVLILRVGQEPAALQDANVRRVVGQGLRWTACATWGRFCS